MRGPAINPESPQLQRTIAIVADGAWLQQERMDHQLKP
jgi:hypothetical protein